MTPQAKPFDAHRTLRNIIYWVVGTGVVVVLSTVLAITVFVTQSSDARQENCESVQDALFLFTDALAVTATDDAETEKERDEIAARLVDFKMLLKETLGECK